MFSGKKDVLLLFGCRDRRLDYMYRDELELRAALGDVGELVVCESGPDGEAGKIGPSLFEKGYVQEALKRRAAIVRDFLEKNDSVVRFVVRAIVSKKSRCWFVAMRRECRRTCGRHSFKSSLTEGRRKPKRNRSWKR